MKYAGDYGVYGPEPLNIYGFDWPCGFINPVFQEQVPNIALPDLYWRDTVTIHAGPAAAKPKAPLATATSRVLVGQEAGAAPNHPTPSFAEVTDDAARQSEYAGQQAEVRRGGKGAAETKPKAPTATVRAVPVRRKLYRRRR